MCSFETAGYFEREDECAEVERGTWRESLGEDGRRRPGKATGQERHSLCAPLQDAVDKLLFLNQVAEPDPTRREDLLELSNRSLRAAQSLRLPSWWLLRRCMLPPCPGVEDLARDSSETHSKQLLSRLLDRERLARLDERLLEGRLERMACIHHRAVPTDNISVGNASRARFDEKLLKFTAKI